MTTLSKTESQRSGFERNFGYHSLDRYSELLAGESDTFLPFALTICTSG